MVSPAREPVHALDVPSFVALSGAYLIQNQKMVPHVGFAGTVGTGLRIPVQSTIPTVVHGGRSAMNVIPTNKIRLGRNTRCVKELLEVPDGGEVKIREYLTRLPL